MSDTATATATESTATESTGSETLLSQTQETQTETTSSDNPYSALINSDGSFVDGWPNLLNGDEYADVRATAANYKSLPALLKGLKDSKAAAMAKTEGMIKLPGAEATPEEISAYRQALGIPDNADAYQFENLQLPDGIELDGEALSTFKGVAHELNLTPAQAAKLVEFQAGLESQVAAKYAAEEKAFLEAESKKLQDAWGNNFQANFAMAQRAAATFGLDQNNPIFKDAAVVQAFEKIARTISEDKLVKGEAITNRLGPEQQVDDIISNRENPLNKAYHDPSHERHKEAVAEVDRLMKQLYPGS